MRGLHLIGLFAGALLANGALAEEGPGPKAYVCTFEKGNSWSFDEGAFKSAAPSALSFEIVDIDLEKQTASILNQAKATGALRVVRALNANSFLEVANEGFLNLTTVYDRDSTSGTYPAVHSRHFGILGQPIFAQYAGSCTAK
jgi:hypothetical protein